MNIHTFPIGPITAGADRLNKVVNVKKGQGPTENPTKGITKLLVRLPENATSARVVVLLSPDAGTVVPPAVTPLEAWK